jgi:hypothetical protein
MKTGYQEEILQATGNRGVDIILEMLANVNLAHDFHPLAQAALTLGRTKYTAVVCIPFILRCEPATK